MEFADCEGLIPPFGLGLLTPCTTQIGNTFINHIIYENKVIIDLLLFINFIFFYLYVKCLIIGGKIFLLNYKEIGC